MTNLRTIPRFPSAPTTPGQRNVSLPGVRELRPLKGPAIEIPGDQNKDLQARWEAWRARPDGKGTGSVLEFLVWEWLLKKKQIEGVDFIYQYPLMGGRTQFGGFVADFYFPTRRQVWNPAGLRFHHTKTTDRARDRLARKMLAARGIKLIMLYEDDMLNRLDYVLEKAWNGEEVGWRRNELL